MPFHPNVGARVNTARFGPGVVLKVAMAGALVALDRLSGTPIGVSFTELSPEGGDNGPLNLDPVEAAGGAGRSKQDLSERQLRARRSIESLRFGIVPVSSIRDVTVGFDELEAWVIAHLPHQRGGRSHVSEVSGSFGSGKSHTMAAIREVAQANGYVTTFVEVNGNDVSLSDPEGMLRQLWPTAAANELESVTPWIDLNLEAIDNGKAQAASALADYDRVAANLAAVGTLRQLDCLDPHVEDCEGFLSCGDALTAYQLQAQLYEEVQRHGGNWRNNPFTLKRLIGRDLIERPTDFVNCLLGYSIVARRAGYKGLVITIDEFEVEYNLSRAKFERVRDLIRAMWKQLGGKSAPLSVFVASVGQDGHTGDAVVGALVKATGGDVYALDPWSEESLNELAERIHALYCTAYGLSVPFDRSIVDHASDVLDQDDLAGSGAVRSFIKQYVATLDGRHGPGTE